MNLQELQTIVHHNLPIKIFLINNQGYLSIRITQNDWFGSRYAASSKEGGVSFPDMKKVAKAYGIKTEQINHHGELREKIKATLTAEGPVLCEIMMKPDQPLVPYMTYGKRKDGTSYPLPLEDMFPLLPREEFHANMLIEPWIEP